MIGELANNNGAMRPFVQTFVLASQSAKKYYVHNDIFRYQDDVFHANGPSTEQGFTGQQNHVDGEFEDATKGMTVSVPGFCLHIIRTYMECIIKCHGMSCTLVHCDCNYSLLRKSLIYSLLCLEYYCQLPILGSGSLT